MVQLVGPEHVGIGLDVVFGAEALNDWMRERPDEWPGVESPDWPGVRYAAPHQLSALADLLADAGYPKESIESILGRNYERVCQRVWS
jgi:membrane dipeptidase